MCSRPMRRQSAETRVNLVKTFYKKQYCCLNRTSLLCQLFSRKSNWGRNWRKITKQLYSSSSKWEWKVVWLGGLLFSWNKSSMKRLRGVHLSFTVYAVHARSRNLIPRTALLHLSARGLIVRCVSIGCSVPLTKRPGRFQLRMTFPVAYRLSRNAETDLCASSMDWEICEL